VKAQTRSQETRERLTATDGPAGGRRQGHGGQCGNSLCKHRRGRNPVHVADWFERCFRAGVADQTWVDMHACAHLEAPLVPTVPRTHLLIARLPSLASFPLPAHRRRRLNTRKQLAISFDPLCFFLGHFFSCVASGVPSRKMKRVQQLTFSPTS
jgi:hypothetical protein